MDRTSSQTDHLIPLEAWVLSLSQRDLPERGTETACL